eukprot:CAMPEP_0198316500 /NCGR_PEP_ID=MMETSP1450-20131203/6369_1 /TAXON_ID=753684 ORGANISM="Madagascaria erythrocladiodes, Strain CCMP3234" /NCGR_SAMPLE_ID=MMETSP1450 /ASSEMBLY_ACC=CAM_ASM_001115 /LENGTH=191 /DNA_ID=CAMNT_0044019659 /DNA_START=64 /DNA_END=639 /DNA_ORIENTATION=+
MAEEKEALATTEDASTFLRDQLAGLSSARMPTSADLRAALSSAYAQARPWSEFANTAKCAMPKSTTVAKDRVLANALYYRYNYLLIFLAALVVTVLVSPLAVLGVIAVAALGVYLQGLDAGSVVVAGKEVAVDDRRKGVVMGVVSLVVLWVTGAGLAIMNLAGLVGFVAAGHAVAREHSEEADFETAYEQV